MKHTIATSAKGEVSAQGFLGWICSKCNKPRLLVIDAKLKTSIVELGKSRLPGQLIKELSIAAAEKLPIVLQERIEQRKSVIVDFSYGFSYARVDAHITGIKSPCPCCGFQEPWQTPLDIDEEYRRLVPDNYPKGFSLSNDAMAWVSNKLQRDRQNYRQYWIEHHGLFDELNPQKEIVEQEISSIQEKIAALDNDMEIQQLTQKKNNLEEKRDKTSIFSADRKTIVALIKKYQLDITDRNSSIEIQKKQLNHQLDEKMKIRADLMRELRGSVGEVVSKQTDNSYAFDIDSID